MPHGQVDAWFEVTDVEGDLVRCDIQYRFTSSGEELVSSNELRFRRQAELTQGLEQAGFTVQQVFGDWDRRPVSPQSPELIFIATRD